jgi:hypothetical protein
VLAGEQNLAVRALQQRANSEPLTRPVKRVSPVGVSISLPRIGSDAFGQARRVFVEIPQIVRD